MARMTHEEILAWRAAERAAYTWSDAKKDLALTTRLMLGDAGRMLGRFEGRVHPYDIVLPMTDLIAAAATDNWDGVSGAIFQLMNLEKVEA